MRDEKRDTRGMRLGRGIGTQIKWWVLLPLTGEAQSLAAKASTEQGAWQGKGQSCQSHPLFQAPSLPISLGSTGQGWERGFLCLG